MRQKELKKQYHLLFIVVTAITMFVFCVIGLYDSYNSTQINQRKNIYGGWHIAFLHTTQDAYEKISNHAIVNKVGKMELCGFVDSVSGQKTYTVGHISDSMGTMGGIKVEMGDYPKEENELAVEAAALSVLGEAYDLGDEIEFCYYTYDEKGQKVNHREEFVLTGIIHNYSDVWKNRNDSLIHFFVSPAYGEKQVTQSLNCYIQVKEQYASNVSELKPLLGGKGVLIENDYTYDEYAEESTWLQEFIREEIMIFMVIIFAIFILIALINTMISHRRESFVLIRSIGGERKYIIKSLAEEIIPVLVSGIIWGILLGIFIPALLFRILGLYWENVTFMIQPKHALLAMGGIILTCFISCFVGCVGILKIPMHGGIKYQAIGKNGGGYKWSRRLSLLTTFCIGCVFICSCHSCYLTYYDYEYYKELYPYDYKYGYMPFYAEANILISAEVLEKVSKCYGVESVSPYRISPYYEVKWKGMEESRYTDKLPIMQNVHLPEEKREFNSVYTCLYEVANGDERTFNEFAEQIDAGEITYNEFKNGNKVIIYLPPLYEWGENNVTTTKNQLYWLQEKEIITFVEDTIKEKTILEIHGEKGIAEVEVGAIICKRNENETNRLCMPLTIVGSEKIGRALNDIDGYTCIEIYGDKNINQAKTEVELNKYCPEGVYFKSERAERYIKLCHFLIQLLIAGVTNLAAIVLFIIIKNGIWDNYREIHLQRSWLLYALGMPKWKIYGQIVGKEIGMAIISNVVLFVGVLFKIYYWDHEIAYFDIIKGVNFGSIFNVLENYSFVKQRITTLLCTEFVYIAFVVCIAFRLLKRNEKNF